MVGGQSTPHSSQLGDNRYTPSGVPTTYNVHTPYYSPQTYPMYPQTYYSPQFFSEPIQQYGLPNYYGTTYYPPSYYPSYAQPKNVVYYPKPNNLKFSNTNPKYGANNSKTPDLPPEIRETNLKHDGQLPRILFPGTIIIVNSIEKVKPALAELFRDGTAMTHGIGFDMEWKPTFGKGAPRNPTSLIQLATDKVCVIFWMMHLGHQMPLELFEVLASPSILKIGQSLDCGDNERLTQEFHLDLVNSVDISIIAKRKGFRKTNLKEQTRVLLGKNLSKFLCTSNWADVHLTPAQIRYAATDPYVTFLIYHKLQELTDAPITPVAPPEDESESEGRGEGGGDAVSDDMASLSISSKELEVTPATRCPHCSRYFMKKVQVYAHLDHDHYDLLPAGVQTCSVCSKQFRKYTALLIHQEMTGHFDDHSSSPSSPSSLSFPS